MPGTGTIINVIAIILGGVLEFFLEKDFPKDTRIPFARPAESVFFLSE